MIDFSENIESLEKMVWNFVLNEINQDSELKPKNHNSLRLDELIPMIKYSYFNEDNRQLSYKFALKFFKEYGKIPNKKELKSFLDLNNSGIDEISFDDLYTFNLRDYNYDYLYKYVKSFILLRNLNSTVFDVLSFLKTSTVDPTNIDIISEKIRNDINSKLAINFSSGDTGLNFFNPVSHIQVAKNSNPTGFSFFDKTQGGGWNEKTLVVFQGRPKVGKSMVLGNIAGRSLMAGNITGLVTVELSQSAYMKRIGSNLLNIKADEYAKITDAVLSNLLNDKIKTFTNKYGTSGDLDIIEFPTGGVNAIEIENHFLRLENIKNKKFKVIIVDYLNLLRPIKEQKGLYEKIKAISEELRGVAQRNRWCIISATQIRREDVSNFDLGMESVAESFGLIHTVDALYGLMRSPLEKRMKIKVIANRDNGYEESYKFYQMTTDNFRLSEETGINSEYYSDDQEISTLEEEIRDEYNALNNSSQVLTIERPVDKPIEKVIDATDYDALFSSIK